MNIDRIETVGTRAQALEIVKLIWPDAVVDYRYNHIYQNEMSRKLWSTAGHIPDDQRHLANAISIYEQEQFGVRNPEMEVHLDFTDIQSEKYQKEFVKKFVALC